MSSRPVGDGALSARLLFLTILLTFACLPSADHKVMIAGEDSGTLGFTVDRIGKGKRGKIILCSEARNRKERVCIRLHKHAALQVGRNAYPGQDGTVTDVLVRDELGEAISDNNFVQKRTQELGPVVEMHDGGNATIIIGG